MARTAWQFNGYSWPVNPETDTDWVYEPVIAESVPINSNGSSVQIGGRASARRSITGWLFGPKAEEQRGKMIDWLKDNTIANLSDHLGNSKQCMLVRLELDSQPAGKDWRKFGRQYYKYSAEFVEII